MSQPILNAEVRTVSTKGALNTLRKNGKIPAVMYNRHAQSTILTIDGDEYRKVTKGISESTLIKLMIDGKENEVFIKDRHIDWLHSRLLHIDFFQAERGVAIRVKVPVHLNGNPIGVREGGILENPTHEVEVECIPKDMPERFEVDIDNLKANQSIHVSDLKLAAGVKMISAPEQVIALVKYAKGEAPTEEAGAETAE